MTNRRTTTPRRVPAHTVRHADGFTSYVNAVDIVAVSAVTPCWCAACSTKIPARAEYVIASRVVDTAGVHAVPYCTAECRARFVGGAK